jgi:hypothetical protein
LFAETALALNSSTRSLGAVLSSQDQGAISAPSLFERTALIWPQATGLVVAAIGLSGIADVAFRRQEARARGRRLAPRQNGAARSAGVI